LGFAIKDVHKEGVCSDADNSGQGKQRALLTSACEHFRVI